SDLGEAPTPASSREQAGPSGEMGGPSDQQGHPPASRAGASASGVQGGPSAPPSGPPASGDPEQSAPIASYGDAFGEIEEEEQTAPSPRPFASKSDPKSGPRLHAVPPSDTPKRRPEFQAGSDLSDLLAKKQLDFDNELRRRPEVRSVEFQQIGEDGEPAGNSLDMLMDIRLPISVELGRTQMLVRDILDYGPGTVIELDKLAG